MPQHREKSSFCLGLSIGCWRKRRALCGIRLLVMAVREDLLLEHIYRSAAEGDAGAAGGVLVGPGDDAAVVSVGGASALVTTDQLIAGRHFDADSTPVDQVGRKAIARCLSDIAAMGGAPVACVVAAALPAAFEQGKALVDALRSRALVWRCPLVGGDIALSQGPLALTVTAMGAVSDSRGPVLRDGAKPGDGVYVTGAIGASLATGWHLRFTPRLEEASVLIASLGSALTSMIDISDGLGKDAARIARASGATLRLNASAIPLRDAARSDWRQSLCDGEDYELLFTASADPPGTVGISNTPVTRIGEVVVADEKGPTCVVVAPDGEHIDARAFGWEHAE